MEVPHKLQRYYGLTTTDVKEGSYALNVTHTQATAVYFRVILEQNYDLSSYDAIFFWMKITSPDASYNFYLYMHESDTNWGSPYFQSPYSADAAGLQCNMDKMCLSTRLI